MPRVRVVSFDLWDTVFIDDSDEPKRTRQGLPPKGVERRDLVRHFLARHAPVERALVDCAYDTGDAAFREVWHNQHVTWPVEVRLRTVLAGLNRELPEGEFRELVRLHEEMELGVRGDREHNDTAGAKDAGARAVLITAAVDRGSAHPRADAVCRNFAQLPEIIGALDGDTYAIHTSVSDH